MLKRILLFAGLAVAFVAVLSTEAFAGEQSILGPTTKSYIIVSDGGTATNLQTRQSNFHLPPIPQMVTFHCDNPCYICTSGQVCGIGYGPPFPAHVAVSTTTSGKKPCKSWDGGTVSISTSTGEGCISASPAHMDGLGGDGGLVVYFFQRDQENP